MRMGKGIVVGLLCLVLVFAICLPRANAAHSLDGAWFKMKLTVKGYLFNQNDGAYQTYNFSEPVYIHLTWDAGQSKYTIDVWTVRNAGWVKSFTTHSNTSWPGENFIQDLGLMFYFRAPDGIATRHTPFINIKTDAVGGLQQAKWQGTGEVYDGIFETITKRYYGYFNLTGQTVDPSKLPVGVGP